MKNKKEGISAFSIERLLLYSKCLTNYQKRTKKDKILSNEIASLLKIDSAQVRKDLSYIGKLGKRGTGYFINSLLDSLNKYLNRNRRVKAVIVGIGKLGAALIGYKIFSESKIDIVAGFDNDKRKVGIKVNNVPIYSIDELTKFIRRKKVDMGVITTPSEVAYDIAKELKNTGIKAIINFAPIFISFNEDIFIHNVDISIFFELARFHILSHRK